MVSSLFDLLFKQFAQSFIYAHFHVLIYALGAVWFKKTFYVFTFFFFLFSKDHIEKSENNFLLFFCFYFLFHFPYIYNLGKQEIK